MTAHWRYSRQVSDPSKKSLGAQRDSTGAHTASEHYVVMSATKSGKAYWSKRLRPLWRRSARQTQNSDLGATTLALGASMHWPFENRNLIVFDALVSVIFFLCFWPRLERSSGTLCGFQIEWRGLGLAEAEAVWRPLIQFRQLAGLSIRSDRCCSAFYSQSGASLYILAV